MKKLLLIIVLASGYWYWNGGRLPFMKQPVAVDSAGKAAVWIFTFDGCGPSCDDAVQELKNRHLSFEQKRINPDNADDANVKLWKKFSAGNQFPLIVMGGNSVAGFYKPNIATLLGKTYGDVYLTDSERRYFKQHFNANGSPRIVLYGTDWCGYCADLRKDLRANHVDFVDIDVEKSGEHQLMSETMGINGYPAVWIGYSRLQGNDYAAVKVAMNGS